MALRAPAPTATPAGGTLDQRLSQLAIAVSRKADVTTEPTYNAIMLRDSAGATWRVTVDTAGVLHTAAVTRT
jgi:hypothetical protein